MKYRRRDQGSGQARLFLAIGSERVCMPFGPFQLTASVIGCFAGGVTEEGIRLDVDVSFHMWRHSEGQADHLQSQARM